MSGDQQLLPMTEEQKRWRAVGRAEAARLLMEQDAEMLCDGLPGDLTANQPNHDAGDYSVVWNAEGVLKFFDAGDGTQVVESVIERAEILYWSTRHEVERLRDEVAVLRGTAPATLPFYIVHAKANGRPGLFVVGTMFPNCSGYQIPDNAKPDDLEAIARYLRARQQQSPT